MTEVYTFYELLSDIIKNKIPMSRVLTYLYYLAPMLIYGSTSMSAMVAVLVTFGVMTKNNEVIAFKSCGISLLPAVGAGDSGQPVVERIAVRF